MRNVSIYLFCFITVLGCDSNDSSEIENPLANSTWRLLTFFESDGSYLNPDYSYDVSYLFGVSFRDSTRAVAWDNCNRVDFLYKIRSDRKVQFSDFTSTTFTCEDSSPVDPYFLVVLKNATSFDLVNNNEAHFPNPWLVLKTSNTNEILSFVQSDWYERKIGAGMQAGHRYLHHHRAG